MAMANMICISLCNDLDYVMAAVSVVATGIICICMMVVIKKYSGIINVQGYRGGLVLAITIEPHSQ
jgi:hypothetical protein